MAGCIGCKPSRFLVEIWYFFVGLSLLPAAKPTPQLLSLLKVDRKVPIVTAIVQG